MTASHEDAPSVLRLITRLNVGGPARHALLLTKGLADRYPTTLAAGTPAADEGELLDPAVPVHRVPLTRPLAPTTDVRGLVAIRSLLARRRPAILHTHMAKAGALGRTASLTVHPRPRTVHTFHGHVLEGYFSPAIQRAFILAERGLARATDVLVAVSTETRDELLDLGIGRPAQYRVIPLGLDLSAHLEVTGPSGQLRARLGLGPEVPLVGIVGRLVPIKDVETAIAAIERLPGVHLAVVGDGELRSALEGRVATSGLADRVHFTGWWHDVPSVLSDLDVTLLTSRNEGTPVALIEASACARPVVATAVGGVAAVVVDGVTGYLRPAGDVEGLARALGEVLADRALASRLGVAGRQHVAQRFGGDRLVADIGALYDELLA